MAVLVLCLSGVAVLSTQVRCIDAAREAARLVARGDTESATVAARRIVGDADVQIRRDGVFVVARVSVDAPLLPGLRIGAEAVSVAESGP